MRHGIGMRGLNHFLTTVQWLSNKKRDDGGGGEGLSKNNLICVLSFMDSPIPKRIDEGPSKTRKVTSFMDDL